MTLHDAALAWGRRVLAAPDPAFDMERDPDPVVSEADWAAWKRLETALGLEHDRHPGSPWWPLGLPWTVDLACAMYAQMEDDA